MPTYDFRCPNGHAFERFWRKMSEAPLTLACVTCGAIAERQMSAGAGLVFKGSGFYLTDYGRNAHRRTDGAPNPDRSGERDGSKGDSESSGSKTESGGSKSESRGESGSEKSESSGSKSESKDASPKGGGTDSGSSSGSGKGESGGGSSNTSGPAKPGSGE